MKRAIVVVVDSMGCGAMPDAKDYSDRTCCNTLKNVAEAAGGIDASNLYQLGLGNIIEIKGIPKNPDSIAQYGIMQEASKGKDTTTGHWEMMGLVLKQPFKVYPKGFPKELIRDFINKTGCKGILGNYPASGTKIIEDLNREHQRTMYPIIYTSADSVFQIAVDIDIVPIHTLYKYCEIARELLDKGYGVSRVIARPYRIMRGKFVRIGSLRRDYSVKPSAPTLCDELKEKNTMVLGIGKIEDIFVGQGITHSIHTGSNKEGLSMTIKAVMNNIDLAKYKLNENAPDDYSKTFIFTNLVDTDMLYGHRNDPLGYASAIEEVDTYLPQLVENMTSDDILIITADHGCDPTEPGTDHTREQVPILVYHHGIKSEDIGIRPSFTYVAQVVRKWLLD